MLPASRSPSARVHLARVLPILLALACIAPLGCKQPDSLEAIRKQQAAGDYQGSLEPLRSLLAESPDDPEINFLYGQALVQTQRGNIATWSLRKAMNDPQWLVPAGLQLAYAALAAYDFNEVDTLTTRVLEQEPENVPALLMRAQAHAYWRKDPEQALADANRVLEIDPDAIEAYEPRILALLALDRQDEAREQLAEAGRRLEESGASEEVLAWHCSTTAVFQQDAGEMDAARETWARCLEAHPDSGEVVAGAISFYDGQGEMDRSLEVARAALAAAPGNRIFRTALADRLRAAGEPAEAEALLREATDTEDPQVAAAAWVDLALLFQKLDRQGEAADAYGKALELAKAAGPVNPELPFDYADALVLAGRLDQALEVADGLSLPAHQHLIRARVAQERHDPATALEEFDAGMRLWPDNPWARYQSAKAAEELGDFDRALEDLRYSIRISPGATDARYRAARQLLAEGKPRLAIDTLRTAGGEAAPLDLESQVLLAELSGLLGDLGSVQAALVRLQPNYPAWAARALARAADGIALRAGPKVAFGLLASAPVIDYSQPASAEALRALIRYAYAAGQPRVPEQVLAQTLSAHPDSSALQEIRGFDLELSGAPPEQVRAAYQKALDLQPANALALAGLGRMTLKDDPAAAVALFDRAAAADPSDPDPKLAAARALIASGRSDEAAQRLDALLLEHPYEAAAAEERARLDLAQGQVTPRTVERAQRAVRFRGGVEALELLSEVYAQQGDSEQAAAAAERARTLREAMAGG